MVPFRSLFWLPFVCGLALAQSAAAPRVPVAYGRLPPVFEENRGQTDAEAAYFLRGSNLSVFVTKTGAVLSLRKGDSRAAVSMEVAGANGKGAVTGEAATGGMSSYFRGGDSAQWISGAPQFHKVRIREARQGVDVLYYANGNRLEYDLVVKPGQRPEDIGMRFAGADKVVSTKQGDVRIVTAAGDLVQRRPTLWQDSPSGRVTVSGRYRVTNTGEVFVVAGKYDRSRDLVIDPVISYSTYLGGTLNDQASAIAVDGSGNAYITGQTNSANFPTTVGAYSVALKVTATSDVFVAKLNSTGTALLYSTYLGGSAFDAGAAIAIDASGNAYIAGSTQSTDFPTTTGVLQTARKGASTQNAFVAKLNSSGTALTYSTYLGGSGSQNAAGLRVDSNGNAYVAGYTSSNDFPTTVGAYATALPGSQSAFVAKINPAATALVYSTYLGGTGSDSASSLALDSSNNVYVAGQTQSVNFPATTGAYQTTEQYGVTANAFVAKLSADGATLMAATYLGGGLDSTGYTSTSASAIALDSSNNPYVTGYTYSPSFPTTAGAFSVVAPSLYAYYPHSFVTKFNPSLTAPAYSTLLGGSGGDYGYSIAVDSSGHAYVAGGTNSSDFPISPGSLLTKKYGAEGAFLAQVDPTGGSLNYSTYLGGTGSDIAYAVALDSNQGVYVAGSTSSVDFPVTAGAAQSTSASGNVYSTDGFVTKLDLSSQVTCSVSVSPSSYTAPLGGSSSSFAITALQGCPWVLVNSNTSSVTINGPNHGIGNGTVNFTVASNAGGTSVVSSSITVGSAIFSISQVSGSCITPILTPTSATFGIVGGLDQLNVGIASGCAYAALSSAPWLRITSSARGTGSATIDYFVDTNDFATRSATITVAGASFPVTQTGLGCTATASVSATTGAAGGTGAISLAISSNNCAWKAYPLASWIQIATSTGTGSATIGIVLAPNPGTAQRTGQIQIAGQTLTVGQAAGPVGTPSAYTISTLAGNGSSGFAGDGGPASAAQLTGPAGLVYDTTGSLYVADGGNNRIRKIGLDGTISTVAGNGSSIESGNGGAATSAGLYYPLGVALGPLGDLFVYDYYGYDIRKITNGIISNLASNVNGYALAVDSSNNVYLSGYPGVQKITSGGAVSTFAGNGTYGFMGDGGAPIAAELGYNVNGLAVDSASNLYISDTSNSRVRRISGNVINTIAGNGNYGFNGDGLATSSSLNSPQGLAIDPIGNVIVADPNNYRVRRFTPGGNITTIAGNGSNLYNGNYPNGDGGPAFNASFGYPSSVAIDPFGNIAVSDPTANNVRLLTPSYSFCAYSISSSSATVTNAGATLTPTVTTTSGCQWNVYTSASWITLSASSGSGSGTVTLNVAANPGGAARSATVSIAGQNYTVTQTPGPSVTIEAPAIGAAEVGTITVSGWALDNTLSIGNSISSVQILVDGVVSGNATYGISRADVCTTYPGRPGCPNVGFTYSLNTAPLTTGNHTITVNAVNTATPPVTGTASVNVNVTGAKPSVVSVSPAYGSGNSQVFTVVYSDTVGASTLSRKVLIINSTLSAVGACAVEVNSGGIYLYNDSDTALLGPVTGGSSLSNSQCSLSGSDSSATNSGNNSTVALSLTFTPAFVGAKTVYGFAADTYGNNTGYVATGNFTVTAPPAITGTVTPASGSGNTQTFTMTFQDTGGAAVLNREVLIINSSLSPVGACAVEIDNNNIFLINDADSGLLGPSTAGNFSNSQCTLNQNGTGTSSAGNTWTATISLTFSSSFTGQKNIYTYVADSNGHNTGYPMNGTYTVTAPISMTLTPTSGSGSSQTFTATFTDSGGAAAMNRQVLIINPTLTTTGACTVEIHSGVIFLYDPNTGFTAAANNGNTLSTAECSLSGTASGVVSSGNTTTATVALSFTSTFAGAKNLYLYASDTNGNNSGYQALGSFTAVAPAPVSNPVATPGLVSIAPSSGSASSQVFSAVFSDTFGASVLTREVLIINSTLNAAGACAVEYQPPYIFLINDGDNGLLGPLTAGSSLSNSQCTLSSTGTGASSSGNNTTLNLSLAFKTAFAGAKNLYMFAADSYGQNTGFQAKGTFMAVASAPTGSPSVTSITPSSGSGGAQTFTAVFSDTAGGGALNRQVLIINSTLTAAGSCTVEYDPPYIFLHNDADNGVLGPLTASNTVANSQCTLKGAGSSGVVSGNNSTLALSVAFTASFAGAKNLYLFASDSYGANTGYRNMGAYTVTASGPSAVSLTPTSGTGASQTFTAVLSDTNGASALTRQVFIVNSSLSAVGGCVVEYDPPYIFLINDADSAYLGPLTPTGTLSNSQCALNGSGTGATSLGDNSTLTLSIGFKAGFSGAKNLYLFGADSAGLNTGYRLLGSYTVN